MRIKIYFVKKKIGIKYYNYLCGNITYFKMVIYESNDVIKLDLLLIYSDFDA